MPRTYLSESPYGGSPHVFIATAAYQFHPNYTHALAKSMVALKDAGIAVDLCHIADHVHVDDARNAIVRDFLMSKADSLVFIDNDVGWEPEMLVRLCKHDRDVVAGVYPLKQTEEEYPVRVAPGVELWADEDGLVEVLGVPTGFLKIKRHVLEKLSDAEPRKFYGRGQENTGVPHSIIFERIYKDGVRYSGDYAFCEKWRDMGGKLYVDPTMTFSHAGSFEWSGSLGDHWKRVHGLKAQEEEAGFEKAVQALRSGVVELSDFEALEAGWSNTRWAAQCSLLIACYKAAKKNAGNILELGSGISSIVMGLACEGVGDVYCLEHDAAWASKLINACEKYGITNVHVNVCSLEDYQSGRWYKIPSLPEHFSLVFNDGPPRVLANRSVLYEAMGERLNGAPILVDDAEDENELQALKDWSALNNRVVNTLGKDRIFAVSTVRK